MKPLAPKHNYLQKDSKELNQDDKSLSDKLKDTGGSYVRGTAKGNLIAMGADMAMNNEFYESEEGYTAYKDPQLDNYKEFIASHFWKSKSSEETKAELDKLLTEFKDQSNPAYHLGRLTGELTDPSTYIMAFKGVRTALMGSKASQQTKRLSKLIAAEEAGKQILDPERPVEDALLVGGFAFYFNRLGNKLAKYEDYQDISKNMSDYTKASNNETPSVIKKNVENMQSQIITPNSIDDLISNYKREYPDLTIKLGKGIGKTFDPPTNSPAFFRRDENTIGLDEQAIRKQYDNKDYTRPKIEGVKGFKVNDFKSQDEWVDFVVRHELAHTRFKQKKNESTAVYENRINQIAYKQVKENREGVVRTGSLLIDEQKVNEANVISKTMLRNRLPKEVSIDDLEYIPTGLLIEKLGWLPIDRLQTSKNKTVIDYNLNMLKNNLMLKGDFPKPDSAEMVRDVKYGPLLVNVLEKTRNHYKDYLKRMDVNEPKIFKNLQYELIGNVISRNVMTFAEFRKNIPVAILDNYKFDNMPEIEAAARMWQSDMFGPLADRIKSLGMTLIQPTKELDFWSGIMKRMRETKTTSYKYTDTFAGKTTTYNFAFVEQKIKDITKLIDDVNYSGTRQNYFSILYRYDKIIANFDDFKSTIVPRLIAKGFDKQQIDGVLDNFKTYKPYEEPEIRTKDVLPGDEYKFAPTGYSKFLKARTLPFDVDDYKELLSKGFIESDINIIGMQYYKSIVPDIVLTEKFGDPFGYGIFHDLVPDTFAPGLRQIAESYQKRIMDNPKLRNGIEKERNKMLEDSEAIRDLFKGRFGLVENPHRAFSRTLRIMKQVNTLTQLTGAFSALPDIARVMTYSGFSKTMPKFVEMLSKGISKEFIELGTKQGKRANQIIDMWISWNRANNITGNDTIFADFSNFERFLNKTTATNFQYINAMSPWTSGMKFLASVDIGSNIIEASIRSLKGKVTKKEMKRFLDFGITESELKEIGKAYNKHGYGKGAPNDSGYDSIFIANTEKWIDSPAEANAAFRFNRMLNESVDLAIVTPSLGQTPLWMSKEIGSTIGQYKKFGFSFTRNVMQRGLQERDLNFFSQVASLMVLGMFVDYVRTEQLGKKYSKKSMREKMLDGFDRSGLGGVFTDINRIVETASDNKLGMRPLVGEGRPYGTSLAWKVGILGPTASTFANYMKILHDWGRGKHTHHTARRIRKTLPFNNIWYLDSIFDKIQKGIR